MMESTSSTPEVGVAAVVPVGTGTAEPTEPSSPPGAQFILLAALVIACILMAVATLTWAWRGPAPSASSPSAARWLFVVGLFAVAFGVVAVVWRVMY